MRNREVVYHTDGNTVNNDINNLQLLPSQSEHLTIHRLGKHIDTSDKLCYDCKSNKT